MFATAAIPGIIAGLLTVIYALYARDRRTQQQIKLNKVPDDVRRWMPVVRHYAGKMNVPVKIALAVLWSENRGRMKPDGDAGEKGIYQLKPIAIKELRLKGYGNFEDRYATDPRVNIQAGIYFLALNKRYYSDGTWTEALKSYNQGPTGKKENEKLAASYVNKINEKLAFL